MLDNVRISLRIDDLSNWNSSNIILNNGEIALIRLPNDQIKIKIGDGSSQLSNLNYLNEQEFFTSKISANNAEFGLKNYVQRFSVAEGQNVSAYGTYQHAGGYNTEAISNETFAFVWNGKNLYGYNNRYKSHGAGTFSINPENGLSGFYIGEQHLANILCSSISTETNLIITNINTNNAAINSNFITLNNKTDTISSNVKTLSTDVSALKTNTITISNDVKNVKSNITTLSTKTDNLSDSFNLSVTNINEKITDVTDDIAELTDYVDLNDENIGILSDCISTLAKNQTSISGNIKTLSTDASTLKTNVNTISNDIKTINNNINSLNTSLTGYAKTSALTSYATKTELTSYAKTSALTSYATKTELTSLSTDLTDQINSFESQLGRLATKAELTGYAKTTTLTAYAKTSTLTSYATKTQLTSYATKTELTNNTTPLSNDVKTLKSNDNILSSKIDNKVLIDNNNVEQLEIKHVSRDEYYNLVNNNQVLSNAIYMVSADSINAYNQKIENVADGIEDTDGANVRQLSYKLLDVELVDDGTNLSCKLENRTISKITIDSDAKPIVIAFPEEKTGYARDFILQVNVTLGSTDNLQIEWEGLDDSWNAVSDADNWAVLEPGLNVISFTEMN